MAEAYASWIQPEVTPDKKMTGLKVNNSLSPGKLVFFQIYQFRSISFHKTETKSIGTCVVQLFMTGHIWDMLGTLISSYIRTYVCSDIIKRLLRDYFGYDVTVSFLAIN